MLYKCTFVNKASAARLGDFSVTGQRVKIRKVKGAKVKGGK